MSSSLQWQVASPEAATPLGEPVKFGALCWQIRSRRLAYRAGQGKGWSRRNNDLVCISPADTSVHLNPGVNSALFAHFPQLLDLLNLAGDELLSTKARVYCATSHPICQHGLHAVEIRSTCKLLLLPNRLEICWGGVLISTQSLQAYIVQ